MIKFLISLFVKITEKQEPETLTVEDDRDFDFVDYDGMGNQGRFPTIKNKKRGRK